MARSVGILYALTDPQIRVLGITVVCTGEVDCDAKTVPGAAGISHILQLVDLANPPYDVPVAFGANRTPSGEYPRIHPFPSFIRQSADDFNGVTNAQVPVSDRDAHPKETAVQLLQRLISPYQDTADQITLIELGPLTNLDDLQHSIYANDYNRINKIVISGSALGVTQPHGTVGCYSGLNCYPDGNIIDADPSLKDQWAEWNIFSDVSSAANILNHAKPGKITLVTLETTNQMPPSVTQLKSLINHYHTSQQNAAADFVYHDLANLKISDTIKVWDAVATVAAADIITESKPNEKIEVKQYPIKVDSVDDQTIIGKTSVQPQGIPNIGVVRIDDPSSPAPFVNSFYSEFWDNGINRDQQKLAIRVKNTTSQKSVYEVNAERQAVMAFGETCAVVLGQTSSHCIHQTLRAMES